MVSLSYLTRITWQQTLHPNVEIPACECTHRVPCCARIRYHETPKKLTIVVCITLPVLSLSLFLFLCLRSLSLPSVLFRCVMAIIMAADEGQWGLWADNTPAHYIFVMLIQTALFVWILAFVYVIAHGSCQLFLLDTV